MTLIVYHKKEKKIETKLGLLYNWVMFNSAAEKGRSISTRDGGEWDSVAEVDFAGEHNDRQQKKIAACLLTKNYDFLNQDEVDMSETEGRKFLVKLGSGEIGIDDERELLLHIEDPINIVGQERMFENISRNGYERWIMAYMAGYDTTNWGRMDNIDVAKFVHDFPTPIDFEEKGRRFLAGVRPQVSEIEYGAYAAAMTDFKKHVYGKRQEYWEQMKLLNGLVAGARVETVAEPEHELRVVSQEIKEALLANARIEGDDWVQDGKSYRLTPETLERNGLGPKYEMSLGGRQIVLSDVFMADRSGRCGAIGYIPTENGVKVRGFYKSNSQGVWRYLPDYVKTDTSREIDWYGKGTNEESTMLPLEMQEMMARIQDEGLADVSRINSAFLLGGTAYAYRTHDEYFQTVHDGRGRGDFYREVSQKPVLNFGHITRTQKRLPSQNGVVGGAAPDFSRARAEFGTTSSLVGDVKMESYLSEDGKFEWNFCRDKSGRAWIGGVEAVSPVTSTGVRRDWVSAGDFATPLYEYKSQAAGYGDERDAFGSYQCMWGNYLSKMPIIQDYLRARGGR